MKKLLPIILVVCGLFVLTFTGCNQAIIDTTYKFDKAIIALPNGESIEGEVEKWIDFENSDMIQVKIDGDWYLTHVNNVILIAED